jgi:DNA-binding response OmpR family regulator
MPYKILVADDDVDILEAIELFLEKESYLVLKAENGLKAWDIIDKEHIDLAIIDIMMPELNGLSLVKKIREVSNLPVIILSARISDSDKILGLGLGADDYISKPCSPLEIVARVNAQLRRYYNLNPAKAIKEEDIVLIGDVKLNTADGTVIVKGEPIELTSREYKILKLLMQSVGRILTKKQIFEEVWEDSYMCDDSTIMVHISNIRYKIKDNPKHPIYIKTIKGLGYKFERQVVESEK